MEAAVETASRSRSASAASVAAPTTRAPRRGAFAETVAAAEAGTAVAALTAVAGTAVAALLAWGTSAPA